MSDEALSDGCPDIINSVSFAIKEVDRGTHHPHHPDYYL